MSLAVSTQPWQALPNTRYAYKTASPSPTVLRKRLANGKYRRDADGELEKRCSRCVEYWPADTEFFYPTSSDRDGLGSWCKACSQEKRAAKKAQEATQ